jgi:protein PhnA
LTCRGDDGPIIDMHLHVGRAAPSAIVIVLCSSIVREPMLRIPACLQCGGDNTYPDGDNYVCADCAHEWPIAGDTQAVEAGARDCNGQAPAAGDTVVVIKDLKVKGSSIPLKQGAVTRNIRLVDDDPEHIEGNSEKITGLVLNTCFLRKA